MIQDPTIGLGNFSAWIQAKRWDGSRGCRHARDGERKAGPGHSSRYSNSPGRTRWYSRKKEEDPETKEKKKGKDLSKRGKKKRRGQKKGIIL